MSERDDLLSAVANILADYRLDDLPAPTEEHVDRWIRQFGDDVQLPLLQEVRHVLAQTYIPEATFKKYFTGLIHLPELVGSDPKAFWRQANILDIQKNGQSQTHIRSMFGKALLEELGLEIQDCGAAGGPYVYLDDVVFSGGRLTTDLTAWLNADAPKSSKVHALVMATHQLGEWQCKKRIQELAASQGKAIDFQIWAALRLENRKSEKNSADVLWPASIPEDADVVAYLDSEKRFPFEPRDSERGKAELDFTSKAGRQLMESEFLRAGVKIRGLCRNPKPIMRPLGFSPFGVGFGSTIVTYRNCPNNAPLALWWGDPSSHHSHPFSKWYPLVQRRTYEQGIEFDVL